MIPSEQKPSASHGSLASHPAENFYTSGEYARRNPGWHREHSEWKAAQVLKMLRRNDSVAHEIIEVGCGAGGVLAELQRHLPPSAELTGYDIAPAAIDLARPLENARLRFVLGDFLATQVPPADFLLALDVVEHVDDDRLFLRALCPRAKRHIIQLPLDLSLLSRLQPERLRWAKESVGHLHYYSKSAALALIEESGYRILDWFFTAVELDLPPPENQQQRLRGLRRMGRRLCPSLAANILGGFSVLILCEPQCR
jgi:SAM-dependent methyltransferase